MLSYPSHRHGLYHGVNTQFLGERSGEGVALLNPLTAQKAKYGVCREKGVP